MKILKSLNPDLEASLPKFTVMQNLNHVILIFQNITEHIPEPIDADELNTFTNKYIEFRMKYLHSRKFHTCVKFTALTEKPQDKALSPENLQPTAFSQQPLSMNSLIFERFFRLDAPKTKRINRKILTDEVPFLTLAEKLNLVVTIFDYISRSENDFIRLREIISGDVRFHKKCLAKKLKEGTK
jgi:hypothetical protein